MWGRNDWLDGFVSLMIGLIIAAFIAGVLVAIGLPIFWDWIKPIIHGWTA